MLLLLEYTCIDGYFLFGRDQRLEKVQSCLLNVRMISTQCFEKREDPFAILDALLRVHFSDVTSFCLIAIEECVGAPSLVYCGDLVGKIVHVAEARIQA